MSHHLTENAISRCLIDDGVPQERQHLGECAACRAELAGLESSLAQFRGSIHRWSEREHYRSWCKELSIMNFDNRLKGMYGGHETAAGLSSVVLHVAAVALLLVEANQEQGLHWDLAQYTVAFLALFAGAHLAIRRFTRS